MLRFLGWIIFESLPTLIPHVGPGWSNTKQDVAKHMFTDPRLLAPYSVSMAFNWFKSSQSTQLGVSLDECNNKAKHLQSNVSSPDVLIMVLLSLPPLVSVCQQSKP